MEANSTGGQGSRRAVAPSDDDDEIQEEYKLSAFAAKMLVFEFYVVHPAVM